MSKLQVAPITRRDWYETIWRIVVLVAVEVTGAILLIPLLDGVGLVLWTLIVIALLVWLIRWHADTFAYRCSNCRHMFTISPWRDFVTLHGFDKQGPWYYLKCPRCRRWSRARLLRRKP